MDDVVCTDRDYLAIFTQPARGEWGIQMDPPESSELTDEEHNLISDILIEGERLRRGEIPRPDLDAKIDEWFREIDRRIPEPYASDYNKYLHAFDRAQFRASSSPENYQTAKELP